MVSYHQLARDGVSPTPVNLKHLNKERKRHTEVRDISFRWISDMMKKIVSDMKARQKENKKKRRRGSSATMKRGSDVIVSPS